jgi:hypothetical protein
MGKKKKRQELLSPVVTFRTVTIDFEDRTVTINGTHYGPIEQRGFSFPILSGDAVFMPPRGMERVG